jgi:hypothetical protein
MADNPFEGTEFEESWSEGFLAGFADPSGNISAPSPLTLDQQNAYMQGVTAGQKSGTSWQPPSEPPEQPSGEWLAHAAAHGVITFAGRVAKRASLTALTSGDLWEVAIAVLFSIVIWGPADVPTWDEGAVAILNRMRQQLADNGLVDGNVELFMPACLQTDHDVTDDDELTRLGCWHGRVYADFNAALNEATDHGHPDNTRVLRYQSTFPYLVDVISL